jgi:ubiquinol-cytochrome c reductase cytochrome b subunit
VLAMFGALVILFFIPFLNLSPIRSSVFRPIHQFFFWLLFMDYLILGWIGGCIPETPYYEIGQAATIFYFVYFLLLLPILGIIEYHMLTCDNPSYKTI